ncbi:MULTISPECIES: glycosyltransferase family 4 protein [Mesorhizobium]|uniref:Glycosyltransferase family 1 protein n=1 Tax=Mesorhizobium denitrificans TaxID=2294114 RepID=A0A371X900_9HYPH|nr:MULTISPECIES: glycosyltransferase family 1 protein [Mesorhizobium]RFC65705.1 glycosyltransferase family 1 protein [Mesorhizobium denitrificans]
MSILIVTDAWRPQVNGVALTLERLAQTLGQMGTQTAFLTPNDFRTVPMPSYPEIRLSLATSNMVARRIDEMQPERIHIATEGPLGVLARKICIARKIAFTTSYHTRFPEFIRARVPIPESWSYRWLRNFHNAGKGVLVATPSMGAELATRGFRNIRLWSRGVDTRLFHPSQRKEMGLPRPIFLNVGRVAVEKNLPAFLGLDLPGSKVVVGDGPDLQRLKAKYPDVHFLGTRRGTELSQIYASADVFVFPSKTDTFGNVILEALASGCPVAAYPVTGPLDIIGEGHGGVLSADLREAALAATSVARACARERAMAYDWHECARQFLQFSTSVCSASEQTISALQRAH